MNKICADSLLNKLLLPGLITFFSIVTAFAQAPVITSFSPTSGPVGTSVTITGTGFASAAVNNIVFFGATMAQVTAAGTTSLTVTVPIGATYQPISVLNGNTALTGYSAKPFITTFSPNKGSITAADFNSRATVTNGGWCVGIVIADLDGDGKPDLAMADLWNHTLTIFQNTSVSGSITAGSFGPKVTFAAGSGAEGIAVGDLDGDGKPDLVVTNANDNTLSIYRNTSTTGTINSSSFAAAVTLTTPADPEVVTISDLDGDGKPDLVVSGFAAHNISVFRNISIKGSLTSGSFAAHVDFAADNVTSLAVGDLNGDGKPDFVATDYQSHKISVWRNTTTTGSINPTSFASPVSFATGINPQGAAIGDLDGDGKPDLVVTSGTDTVSVLRNTSTIGSITAGSFAPRVDFITASLPRNVAIGDLDGDGKPDLAIACAGSTVSVLRNMSAIGSISSGSFAAKADFYVGPYSYNIAIGDLDGDGKPDIAVPNSNVGVDAATVSILHNNPFFPPSVQATDVTFSNTATTGTTISWVNGNGLSRAVFVTAASTGNASPVNHINYIANSVFGSGTQIGSSGWYCVYNGSGNTVNITGLSSGATYRVMVAEYNGTAGAENYLNSAATGNPANVSTIPGGPIAINSINLVTASPTNAGVVQFTATFGAAVTGLTVSNFALATTGSISSANIASVTGSGAAYTITANTGTGNGSIGLNLVNATGLTPGTITNLPFTGPVYIIDHTLHTAPVITSFSPSAGLAGTVVTITGTGFNAAAGKNLVFFGATRATVTAASTTSLTVIAPAGATYQPISVLNGGTALVGYADKPFVTTFTPTKGTITTADFLPPVKFTTGTGPASVAIGDLDGDGKPDLVIVNNVDNTVSVLRNISTTGSITTGSFAPKVDFATGRAPGGVALADIDGDGKYDIIVTNVLSNSISVLRNTSTVGSITTASFASKVDFATDPIPGDIKISDLDGDGKADIVITIAATQDMVSIFRNTSTVGSITANSFAARVNLNYGTKGNSAGGMAIGDLDGDGKPDIAVAAFESEAVAVFRNTTTAGSINNINSFAAPVYIPSAFLPVSVTIGDLDGDGKPELVVGSGVISVLRNTSVYGSITGSSFAAHVDYLSTGSNNIAIGDLDGDGKPDLAAVGYSSGGNVLSVLRNTSTPGSINSGSLAPVVDFDTGSAPSGITIADLDGDGRSDLITALYNTGTGNTIAVLQNAPFFPPTVQAINVTFSNTLTNSTTASWTNGNGTSRAVFIRAISTGSPTPVNRTTYTANPFFASGTQIGSTGWYCIYNGKGNTVNITGLSSGATYRVMVVDYDGAPGAENYLTTPSTGNPANVTTLLGGPITINSINLVTAGLTNANSVQFAVNFAANVTGVTASNFALASTGSITGAGITSLTGSGATYTVTVNTGTGNGTIGLNLASASGLTPGIVSLLPFTGQIYTIDRVAPAIATSAPSITTMLSGAGQVTYTVTYADANFNTSTLTASNITLNSDGSATGVVSVSGSGTAYTVTISAITGSGTLGFSIGAGTASDLAGNSAAAAGPSATLLVAPVLSNLTISNGTLSPAFASAAFAYNTTVANAASSAIVTPTTTDPNARVTVNGGSASTPVNLAVGANSITIVVSTLDGNATTTYTIGIARAGQPPIIAYGTGNLVITGAAPFSAAPTNTGGAVPKTNYGQVTTFAGSPAGTSGYLNNTGTAAQFSSPQQAVMDAAGNLYVADSQNNAIRKITPSGVVTTFAGDLTGVFGATDGTGNAALFDFPDGITIDGAGNLYVSDYANNAIRKITPAGVVTTLYSTTNTFGPGGLCIDGSGNVIVTAQDASQIIKITPAGAASIVAGNTPGYTNGIGTSAQFNTPGDVKIDAAGDLYVADFENNAIREISPAGAVTTFAGSAIAGNSPGYGNGTGTAAIFNNPTGLYIGAGGVIYVADLFNNDIRRVMPDGTVGLVAGSAAQAPGDADGTATAAGFNLPDYIYIDGFGTAYVSEFGGNRIRKVLLTGYSLKGTLPTGLTLDAATGIISGSAKIPFAIATDTITAYNAYGYSTTVVTISNGQAAVATLTDLKLSTGTLAPVFAGGTSNYTASELYSTTNITVIPIATDTTASITVNGINVASGAASQQIPLAVGPNTITTVVTAQDGTTKDTYTMVVTRAPNSNALLSDLTVSEGVLSPAFQSAITAYADTVSGSVAGIKVTPTAKDSNATITVNGVAVISGTASADIPLFSGINNITIVVTAQDGVTKDTYTVTVYKGEAIANITATNVLTPNGDGKDDYWVIKDIDLYPQNDVTVFDKGGRVVYTKHGYNNEWDGTLKNGAPLAEGTYYFIVDLGPNLRKFKGFISIIRN